MSLKRYSLSHARKDLPRRKKNDNKTKGGKCLIVAGAEGQWGAAVLCARSAARAGAGYAFIFDFKKKFPTLKFPDFLISSTQNDFAKFDSVALGPGVKDSSFLKSCILKLKKMGHPRVVLDAQALNVLAQQKIPFLLPKTWILTPHEGEMARLLQTSSLYVRQNRKESALALQKKWGCIVLLKGVATLIVDSSHRFENQSGNASLAKAGTGDVLTGIIAGLLSQNIAPLKAACLGSFIHGHIADLWVKQKNDSLSLLATDLVEFLPKAIADIRALNDDQRNL